MKDKFFVYIEPYIEINIEKDKILLYNTLDGKYLKLNNQEEICFIEEIKNNSNRIVVEKEHVSIVILNLLKKIKLIFFGDFWIIKDSNFKLPYIPIIKPDAIITKIENNTQFLKKDLDNQDKADIISQLQNLTIILNPSFKEDHSNNYIFKQIRSNYFNNNNLGLSFEHINKIYKEISSNLLREINFVGCNLPNFRNYITPKNLSYITNYYFSIEDFVLNFEKYCELFSIIGENNVNYYINFGFQNDKVSEKIKKLFDQISIFSEKITLNYIIENETDIKLANEYSEVLNLSYNFVPIFNNTNIEFFKDNVFNSEEDILEETISKKIILQRQIINSNFFGALTVLPNGNIHSNLNYREIGNISDIELYEAIYCEYKNKTAWFLTRNKVEPCKNCNYCNLCPPISNYELHLNKFDLCFKSK
jgi:pseudo-rSAM protein